MHSSGHVLNPSLYPNLGYDTQKDLTGITLLAALPNVLVVNPARGWKTQADLVAAAKARPGQLNYASAGMGSSALLPNLPTSIEAGAADSDYTLWVGLLAPSATPAAVIKKLHEEVTKALASADIKERLAKMGAEPLTSTPEAFNAAIRAEMESAARIAKAANLKAQ